jgi:hypothetical protein
MTSASNRRNSRKEREGPEHEEFEKRKKDQNRRSLRKEREAPWWVAGRAQAGIQREKEKH